MLLVLHVFVHKPNYLMNYNFDLMTAQEETSEDHQKSSSMSILLSTIHHMEVKTIHWIKL